MHRVVFSFLAVLLAASAFAADLTDAQRAAIEARIKPVGESCMEGDNTCGAPAVAASTGPRSGEEVYNTACMACHATGAAGAPKMGDKVAWAPRIKTGNDALYASSIKGKGAMPPKGGNASLGDADVKSPVGLVLCSNVAGGRSQHRKRTLERPEPRIIDQPSCPGRDLALDDRELDKRYPRLVAPDDEHADDPAIDAADPTLQVGQRIAEEIRGEMRADGRRRRKVVSNVIGFCGGATAGRPPTRIQTSPMRKQAACSSAGGVAREVRSLVLFHL